MKDLLARRGEKPSVGFFAGFQPRVLFRNGVNAFDVAFDIARAVDPAAKMEDFAHPLEFRPVFRDPVADIYSQLPPICQVLAVHSETKDGKSWPADKLAAFLRAFVSARRDFIVFVVGSSQFKLPTKIERTFVFSGLPISFAMALISKADYFLGVDSCMLHVADLARIPSIGLFGPSSTAMFGFRFTTHRYLQSTGAVSLIKVDAVLRTLLDFVNTRNAKIRKATGPCA